MKKMKKMCRALIFTFKNYYICRLNKSLKNKLFTNLK